jgi:L-lactate dehydrogenase
MTLDGTPDVINEKPAAALWDGKLLPGPWLITEGFRQAMDKAADYGTYSLAIRHSHHSASLVAYLAPVIERGMIGLLTVSDPSEQCVAPFGGCAPVLSTNPMAIGFPAEGGAIMLDMATSETTNGMVKRFYTEKKQFEHDWLIDTEGNPCRDPAIRFAETPGAIMPLGNFSSGHKGTGLGVMVEALSHGLSGNGRHVDPKGWQNNIFLQVIDPSAFAGFSSFSSEMGFLSMAIQSCPPADANKGSPRVPGQRALAMRKERLVNGIPLSDPILSELLPWADKLGVSMSGVK